jgi:hypothetical protein
LDKSIENKPKSNWSRKRAKQYHAIIKGMAKEYMQELKAMRKIERKQERQRDRIATIVADSAATSTVIRNADAEHVDVLETKSQKVFQNANGTLSSAGNVVSSTVSLLTLTSWNVSTAIIWSKASVLNSFVASRHRCSMPTTTAVSPLPTLTF